MGTQGERHQVMILRAWVEPGTSQGLRVRITRVSEDQPDQPEVTAMAAIDDVCDLVRGWLETLLQGTAGDAAEDGNPGDGGVTVE